MKQKPQYKVLIIGLDGAGKTTFLEQVKSIEGKKSMKLDKIPPTVGFNPVEIVKPKAQFFFWDVGGQKVLRKLWEKYYSECNGMIFVIDGVNAKRLDEVKETIDRLYDRENPTDLVDLPALFLLNKSEEKEYLGFDTINQTIRFDKIYCKRQVEILEISALKKDGMEDALEWIYVNVPNQTKAIEEKPEALEETIQKPKR